MEPVFAGIGFVFEVLGRRLGNGVAFMGLVEHLNDTHCQENACKGERYECRDNGIFSHATCTARSLNGLQYTTGFVSMCGAVLSLIIKG